MKYLKEIEKIYRIRQRTNMLSVYVVIDSKIGRILYNKNK